MKNLTLTVAVGLLTVLGACSSEQAQASDDVNTQASHNADTSASDNVASTATGDTEAPNADLTAVKIQLPGMDCVHCAASVRSALSKHSEFQELRANPGYPGSLSFKIPKEFDFRKALDSAIAHGVDSLNGYKVLE